MKITKGDWYGMIQSEKQRYNIQLSDEQISMMNKQLFKRILDQNVEKVAFNEYMKCKKSKCQNIISSIEKKQ